MHYRISAWYIQNNISRQAFKKGRVKKRKFFHMPLFFCFDGAAGIGLALLQLHLAETDQYHVTRFLDDPFPDEKIIKV